MQKLIVAVSVSVIVLMAFAYKPVEKVKLKWMTLKEVEDARKESRKKGLITPVLKRLLIMAKCDLYPNVT